MSLKHIAVSKLEPHPQNPRLFLREDTVAAIAAQIKERGDFDESHALRVRKLPSGNYQIISGHQRFEAAKQAKVDEIPCFIAEMTDEEAFREVLFSNAQSDLMPLEIGMHVLLAVGKSKGGKSQKGGIAEFARCMGPSRQTMNDWVCAAEVAKHADQSAGLVRLLDYTTSLCIIHRCPEEDWADLVKRMLEGSWTKDMTERYVEVIKTLEVPDDLKEIFPRPVLIHRFFKKREFSQATLEGIVKEIRATEAVIRAHEYGAFSVDAEIESFRQDLRANAYGMLDVRQVRKWRAAWETAWEQKEAEQAQTQQWHEGDWRTHIDTLSDDSVALVLTDPPYGIDYQSGRYVSRKGFDKIKNDGQEEALGEIKLCFEALRPKLKADARVFCFCDESMRQKIWDVLTDLGYIKRKTAYWAKNEQGPGDLNDLAPQVEEIVHVTRGTPTLYQRISNLLSYPRIKKPVHPNEKPIDLLKALIEATTVEGDLVADPFAGVASTLVAAKELKRTYWGCELDHEFFEEGASRLGVSIEVAA